MKKPLLLFVVLITISNLQAQTNLALDTTNMIGKLEEYIGKNGAIQVYNSQLLYHQIKEVLASPELSAKYEPIKLFRLKMYRALFDTLAYRDIVSQPTPYSDNKKWLKVYDYFLEAADSFMQSQPEWLAEMKNEHDSTVIVFSVSRLVGPNQYIQVYIGWDYYIEGTVEFSEMTYSTTLSQPITKHTRWDCGMSGNNYNPIHDQQQVSYINFYYNAFQQLETDIRVTLKDSIPLFTGRFLGHLRNKKLRAFNRLFKRNPSKNDNYYSGYRQKGKFQNNFCFCEGSKYCPLPQLIHKYIPEDQMFEWEDFFFNDPVPNIEADIDLRPQFLEVGGSEGRCHNTEYPLINNIMLLPTGWQTYYDQFGNITEKLFITTEFDLSKERLRGSSISGLHSKYRTKKGSVEKLAQGYLQFQYLVDSLEVLNEKDSVFYKRSYVRDHWKYWEPVFIINRFDFLKKKKKEAPTDTMTKDFIDDEFKADIDDIIHNWYETKPNRFAKIFYQELHTIYRIYPVQIKEYLKNKINHEDKN